MTHFLLLSPKTSVCACVCVGVIVLEVAGRTCGGDVSTAQHGGKLEKRRGERERSGCHHHHVGYLRWEEEEEEEEDDEGCH